MASIGHFAANFFNGLAQGKLLKTKQDEEKKERDAKLKLFEIQLAREQRQMQQDIQQQDARKSLLDKMQGAEALPGTGVSLMDPTKKGMSLTELLADPESAMMLLQSGMVKGDDILKQQDAQANRAMLEKLMGGGIGGGVNGNMELQGVKVGGGGQIMPDFGLPQITTQTVDTPEGPRIQSFNPRTGAKVADIGAAKEEKVTPEQAGRISGLVQAQEIAKGVTSKYVGADGKVNRALVMSSFGKVPGTEGRQVRNDIEIAIDAVIRARTGSGMNPSEMESTVSQFLPSPLDGDAGIVSKMQRFEQFIGGALDVVTLPPAIRKRLEKTQGAQSTQSKIIDFNSLPK